MRFTYGKKPLPLGTLPRRCMFFRRGLHPRSWIVAAWRLRREFHVVHFYI
jgi:hypothetical protein